MIITPRQLNRRAELYHQLGSSIEAGVPLMRSLEMASTHTGLRGSRKAISGLLIHLKNGLTFSDSMTRVHDWMPDFDVAMLSAGEHSGRLDHIFKILARHYAGRAALLSETIGRLILPMANLHVFLLVFPLSFLIDLVLGIVNNEYRKCIPFFVEKTIAYGVLWGTVFLFIYSFNAKRGERWRSFAETLMRIPPFLRHARQCLVLSRLTAALEALVSSGVSVVKAWPLAAAASGSLALKREVAKWQPELERGTTPSELIGQSHLFPEMFVNVYTSGEISGRLEESLERLHNYYGEEGSRSMRSFSIALTFAIYAMVAGVILYAVVKFWVNYFHALMSAF